MMYNFFIDGNRLPVAPSKLTLKINNTNRTLDLMNLGEVNLLKNVGLTDISFEVLLPSAEYPFAVYDNSGFKEPTYYLNIFKRLKKNKKPFRFLVSRFSQTGGFLFKNNMEVSLESYNIIEDATNGTDIMVSVDLKEYKRYSTQIAQIISEAQNDGTAKIKTKTPRPSKEAAKFYTVKAGDTLWGICKKELGDGNKYPVVAELNSIKNPNFVRVGQNLRLV